MIIYPEASYPLSFRQDDAKRLGDYLKHHDSVVMIGMKRVGINNFLRFFLHHPEVPKTYINNGKPHVFIPIDLNDLVEREIFPFWTLILKRILDVIERIELPETEKRKARKLFSEAIQLKDLFLTIDSVKTAANIIVDGGYYPSLFLIRFDRMSAAVTQEFFNNLQGLRDATDRQLTYVFTSYRALSELRPDIFTKSALAVFSHDMYLKPTLPQDTHIVLDMFLSQYHMTLPEETKQTLITLSGGHTQYLHVSVLKLKEAHQIPTDQSALLELLNNSEEATLLSEELFENLTNKEKTSLMELATHPPEPYLIDIGMIKEGKQLFSPLFAEYLSKIHGTKNGTSVDFTKKENQLFSFLKSHIGELCERDAIISTVWPEYEEAGVSDWAMDRLIARVRVKLKHQNSPYEIVTVITRGYKLVEK